MCVNTHKYACAEIATRIPGFSLTPPPRSPTRHPPPFFLKKNQVVFSSSKCPRFHLPSVTRVSPPTMLMIVPLPCCFPCRNSPL